MVKVDFKPKAELISADASVWEVPSKTESGIRHVVIIHTDEEGQYCWFCSCKGFQFRAECAHIQAVERWQEDYAKTS